MKVLDDQTKALIRVGIVQPFDMVFVGILMLGAATVFYWWVFGHPTATELLVVLLASILWCILWLVALVFRVGVMVVRLRSDVATMPEAAARMAVQMRTGSAPTATKV